MVTDGRVEIHLLGTFECEIDGEIVQASLSRKTRALLAYLAASPKSYNRETLYNLFCQETDDPAGTLRWHLSRIRRLLHPDLLHVDNQVVEINQAVAIVDSLDFQRIITDKNLGGIGFETLFDAVKLYRSEFLTGLNLRDAPEFSIWQLAERTRYAQLYERGLIAVVEHLIAQENFLEAIHWAQILLQNNLLLESAHARLMWLYARVNQPDNALKQYQQCCDVLMKELGVEPSDEINTLYQDILDGNLPQPEVSVQTPATTQPLSATDRDNFVGRAEPLAHLNAVWAQTLRIGTGTVMIDAEAGGGKTRLVMEFVRHLPAHHLLIGQSYESSRNTPYQPWVQLLETLVQSATVTALNEIDSFWYDQLAHLLPTLALQRKRTPSTPVKRDFNEVHLFMAVVHLLAHLQTTAPLVIFIDDLQWADEASLRLFQFVARRIGDQQRAPVLMLGAYRTEEVADNPALKTLLHDLNRTENFSALSLSALADSAIDEFIRRTWAGDSNNFDPARLRERLLQTTGGNPLYLTEVLHELATTDVDLNTAQLPIPDSLNDIVQRRLQLLPDNERQVIDALAIISIPTSSDAVQSISGRSEDEVFTALDAGLRWRLLRALEDDSPTKFAFQHDLIREAVTRQINAIRRERLHQRSAAKLIEMGAPAAQIAYHWGAAGIRDQEAHYIALAGEQAATLYSNKDARVYLQRAIEITTDPQRRAELLVRLGNVLFSVGEWDAAEENADKAYKIANEHDLLHEKGTSLLLLAQLDRNRGFYPEALERSTQAEEIFRASNDGSQLYHVFGSIGSIYWRQADYDNALKYQFEALRVAIEADYLLGIELAHGSLGSIYSQMGDFENALINLEQCLKVARQRDDRGRIGKIIGNIGINYARQDDNERAWACFCEQLSADHELGDLAGVATVLNNLAIISRLQGAFEQSLTCNLYALNLHLNMQNLRGVAVTLGDIASNYIDRRLFDGAEAFSSRAIYLTRSLNVRFELAIFLAQEAKRLLGLEYYADALNVSRECLNLAREIKRQDAIMLALMIERKAQVKVGELAPDEAAQTLYELLETADASRDQAMIYYTIWQITPHDENAREQAAQLYADLYAKHGIYLYSQRYAELTGETLTGNMLDLSLPAFVTENTFDLDAILTRVDKVIESIAG